MAVKIDAHKVLKVIREQKPERGKVSLYLNKDIYREFKKICLKEKVAAGETLDELMTAFVDSIRSK